jgi:hypothetical protein
MPSTSTAYSAITAFAAATDTAANSTEVTSTRSPRSRNK